MYCEIKSSLDVITEAIISNRKHEDVVGLPTDLDIMLYVFIPFDFQVGKNRMVTLDVKVYDFLRL